MKLYAGTTEQFRTDAQMHRIADRLRNASIAQIGIKPGPSEVASWQNSLMALSMLIDQAELTDRGGILEDELGNTSRWLDVLVGHSPISAEDSVVAGLVRWSAWSMSPSTGDNRVELYFRKQARRVPYSSVRVGAHKHRLLLGERTC